MVSMVLVDALSSVLTTALANYTFTTPKGVATAPHVVAGWLPPKDPKNAASGLEDVPYVLIRFAGHDDLAEGDSEAKVHIYVGIYDESHDGWRNVANVLEHIRQVLLKNRTIAKKFRLTLPLKSTIPTEEQPYPNWVGWLETRWTIAQPVEEVIINGESWV